MEGDILFAVEGAVGRVTLNRPKALNALTHDMALRLDRRLAEWASDDTVSVVAVDAAGERAFCAGGDIRALYRALLTPGDPLIADFYRDEYRLNHRIFTYPKPYVALIDGVVMGGGVGISVHGSHRVASEHILFAMPETGIGLFPDVGGSWFLPRMPGEIGMYLGLTGARLKAADARYAGVATHYVPRERHPLLLRTLAEMSYGDDAYGAVGAVLARFDEDPGSPPLAAHRDAIDRCFSEDSVEDILAALAAAGGDWAQTTMAALADKSPTSLKVAFRQLREGAALDDFAQAMRMEYRLSQRFCAGHDFREGVRAVVIDKDNAPQWRPDRLDRVSVATVDAYFAPLGDDDLVL
ncbi:MAG: enoyl-CoA hydratase/isomerase family protein [Alphaproteobacteria bacterium]